MRQPDMADVPQLVVLAPAALRGHRIELSGERMVVGREAASDIWLDDPHVSRTHAALRRHGDALFVEDLGSSGGTFVNEAPATPGELRPGDVVRFASVRARFEITTPALKTASMPVSSGGIADELPGQPGQPAAEPAGPPGDWPAGSPAVHYAVARQQASTINNVGRDQYQAYFQQVVHERDSFLREVTAAKTKARWLIRLGVGVFLAGSAMFVIPGVGFAKQVDSQISSGNAGPVTGAGGPLIVGIPMEMLGWVVAAIGLVIAGVGSRMHQVAVARRGRVDHEHPLPPPWQQLQ
jgi:FHA domain